MLTGPQILLFIPVLDPERASLPFFLSSNSAASAARCHVCPIFKLKTDWPGNHNLSFESGFHRNRKINWLFCVLPVIFFGTIAQKTPADPLACLWFKFYLFFLFFLFLCRNLLILKGNFVWTYTFIHWPCTFIHSPYTFIHSPCPFVHVVLPLCTRRPVPLSTRPGQSINYCKIDDLQSVMS